MQLIIVCGVFAGLLAFAFTFYTKHKDINKKVKYIFIALLSIDLLVFAFALNSSPEKVNSPPVVSLMPDKISPQEAGTTIKWTATALDPEKDSVQYKFLLDGQQRIDWSHDSSWHWITSNADIGSHTIETKVKDGNHNADGDDSKIIDFTISPQTITNQPPLINELASAPDSPQRVGTTITWTADATDPDGDQIVYKYILNGDPVDDWSRDNAWTWQPSEQYIGNNIIEVLVRDKNHADPSGSDDHKSASFIISPRSTSEPEMQASSDHLQEQPRDLTSSNGPIRLSSLGAYHSTFPDMKYDSSADMKIGNDAYEYGIQLIECAFLAPSQYYVAYFNLKGDYSRLTGRIGLDDKTDTSGEVTVYFGKEDNILLDTLKINPGDLPTNVDIDVSGVNRLIISAPPRSSCTTYIDLIDMELK
ncbi:MAG: NPCBM/NEW2 domain-containing protein [Methanotrichaceae archaeon]|nr:NPCBM/NEW2 domain-containing protein [Methanotrichaceae archaeon]